VRVVWPVDVSAFSRDTSNQLLQLVLREMLRLLGRFSELVNFYEAEPGQTQRDLLATGPSGVVFVNLFGWNTRSGDAFAKATTGASAIQAYRKFLSGGTLAEGAATKA
jgi:hypothetical protein